MITIKRASLLISLVLLCFRLSAQYVNPHVSWTFNSKKVSDNEFDLIAQATLQPGFHLYSQFIGEGGPIPTVFSFDSSGDYKLLGKVKESGKRKEEVEPLFDNMKLIWFEDKGVFTQRIKILKSSIHVKGSVNFMTCNDRMCDPPSDQAFEFKLKGDISSGQNNNKDTTNYQSSVNTNNDNNALNAVSGSRDTSPAASASADTQVVKANTNNIAATQNSTVDVEDVRSWSYWKTFLAGFGYGLIALMMPCVWPVIPLTISFFLKHSKEKRKGRMNAVLYGISIVLIFVLLGILVSLLTNEQKLNELSTGWFFNLLFFILFFLFGLSFLGVFEIRVPSTWINKSESLSDKGGLVGIFFMAFTLVLVSFSCTLPFIANLISIVSKDGEFIKPLIGFSAFGLALGLPFGLFAWFPSGLKNLPKSGGWMNTIKVGFGFIEIALSLIYLSKVDMAYHWGFLSRDIFLAIWIIVFTVLGLYLLGKISLEHDDVLHHVSVPRLLFALLCLSFAVYMVPGLWGAPLKPLSGFLPNYSEFNYPQQASISEPNNDKANGQKKYNNLFEAPLGLDLYFDYDEALSHAKEVNKPLFIDFTGWGCVNCRKMEKSVWPDPEVLKRLKNDYVTVSLYVDDKYPLPPKERYFSGALNKEVKTLGDHNFDLQYSRYKIGAQPYYVLLDNNGNLLTRPRGYTSDIPTYVEFLDEGIKEFGNRKRHLSASTF